MCSASSGVATLRAIHLSRASSQTSGPTPQPTSTLLMKTDSQTESSSLKVCVLLNCPRLHFKTCPKSTVSLLLPAGRRVWAYSGYEPVRGYPTKLNRIGLPRGVRKIDAALYDAESGKTLFFVGDYYFRCVQSMWSLLVSVGQWAVLYLLPSLNVSRSYDEARRTVDRGFPKQVDQTFFGLPGKVTAAFQYRGEWHLKLNTLAKKMNFPKMLKQVQKLTLSFCVSGFTYIYSGPYMFEYNLRTGRLYRVLRNSYFLRCTNF